ncbi:MAG: phosphoenolpyruvate synthase, partial [Proteobacteria bacterium]|nr:phosphoenolpyruvate synthase [Pseudomonadota bacterium]
MLRHLRQSYPHFQTDYSRLATLELSLQLEQEAFVAAKRLHNQADNASRGQQLKWLGSMSEVIYGCGLISERERTAITTLLESQQKSSVSLERYRDDLHYLNRLPGWAGNWLKFHFREASVKLSEIEALSGRFIPDRLRSSPLLTYSLILDSLLKDANTLSGVQHQLFGKPIGAGLQPLNPGLARGVLRLPENGQILNQENSIVLLPETTAELPPVAGILTLGEGNALSHVQLLAANLGIPNVVIVPSLQPLLEAKKGHTVVLAVTSGGIVRLEEDNRAWHEYFSRQITPTEGTINPDMSKLDLQKGALVSLADLRADNAGRISGPKAANLGELKHHFPQAVTSGLLVPFAVFREFLQQPYAETGLTVFEWMQSEYRRISALEKSQQAEENRHFLEQLRYWILNTEPGGVFRQKLSRRLAETFGEQGSYAVFVRSDTNVEDLPGFTGAGLNLTVPNVSGFENILQAIQRVWASPFSERAFAWRQNRMSHPEHVYPSVLLMKSVGVDKSGVMLTLDTQTDSRKWLTVAANHGVGGAVQGQAAEELLIDPVSENIRLLADATAAKKRVLALKGGLVKVQIEADGQVLSAEEISKLIKLSNDLAEKFPQRDDLGNLTAADVEFGFKNGQLVLFQVRPYLQNRRVKKTHFLNQLDLGLHKTGSINVDLNAVPGFAQDD